MGMSEKPLAVVVLAAGQGTRMKSTTAKVLHPVSGIPMIGHVLATAQALDPEHLLVVVRHERDQVVTAVTEFAPEAECVDQDDIPGTGRALDVALAALPTQFDGDVVVVSADVPLLDSATLRAVIAHHRELQADATVVTTVVEDPTGYGRVLRAADGTLTGIVEERDATEEQAAVREVNGGTYVFDSSRVRGALSVVGRANEQGEKYLTDVVEIVAQSGVVTAVLVEDSWLLQGVNDRVDLATVETLLNAMVIRGWQKAGVTISNPATCQIHLGVSLEPDVELLSGVALHGQTTVASGAVIGPDTSLTDTVVGSGARVVRSHIEGAVIHEGAQVGPFSYLRPGADIGTDAKVGAFVEIKNSTLHRSVKVPHLSYIGDATIGEGTNIGAGAITANYDGVAKHATTIGDHVKTGSHTVFVAPVTLGDGAYTGAGVVIRRDVPAGALAVMVGSQRNLEGWVEANRDGTPSATAARSSSSGKKGE